MKTCNFFRTMAFTAMTVLAFTACGSEDDPTFAGEPKIEVDGGSATSVATTLEGGNTEAIEVVSAGPWMLKFQNTADETWCTPGVKVGGGGTTQLTFNLAQATADRQAVIDLIATGEIMGYPITATATITVKQNGGGTIVGETNVAEIRALLAAMNPTADKVGVTAELAAMTIKGVVVSVFAGHNFGNDYNIAIQDASGAPNSGLTLNATELQTLQLTAGDIVTAPLTDALVNSYNGVLQLGISNNISISAEKGGNAPDPIEITADEIGNYESQFIQITQCQPLADFVGKAWNSGAFNAGGNGGNVNFVNINGIGFVVRTGNNAAYKADIVPDKSGALLGIAGRYNADMQISPRSAADLTGLTQDRFTVESTKVTIDQLTAGNFEVEGNIVAVHSKGILLADKTTQVNYVLGFFNGGNTNTDKVGYNATFEGTVADRYGLWQFSEPALTIGAQTAFELPAPTTFDAAAIEAYKSAVKYQYVQFTGVLTITPGSGYNTYDVSVSGAESTKINLAYGIDSYFAGMSTGSVVNVKGFAMGYNSGNSTLTIIAREVSTNTSTPYISATGTLSFTKDAGNQQVEFSASNLGSNKVFAKITGTDAAQFSVPAGEVTSPVTVTALANTAETAKNATLTIYAAATENGTAVATATVALTQAGVSSGNDTKGTYTSMAGMLPTADDSNDAYYAHKAKINGGTAEIDVLKFGTGSKSGVFTTAAVGVTGNKKLSFYAGAWKGSTATVYVRINGGGSITPGSYALQANDGVSGSPVYTITFSDATDYYTFDVTGLTATSTITFSTASDFTSTQTGRAIIAGIQLY